MKQNLRNISVFGVVGLAAIALVSGCSDDAEKPLGGGFSGSTSTAGTFTSGGTGTSGSGTGGTGTSGSATGGGGSSSTAGTFSSGGTFSSAGTDAGGTGGSGGTAAGGGGAGGTAAGGGGTGGTAAGGGGTGGGTNGDFPANCPAPTGTHSANAVTRTCWKASATDCSAGNADGLKNPPSNVFDADNATRFSTGAGIATSQGFKFDVDMGKAIMINGVNVASTNATDFPPQIQVAVSTDGTTWTPVACGDFSQNADISFAAVSARYVRLINHGTNAESWWSIGNLQVYRASDADTCTGGETAACTSIGQTNMTTCCGADHKI